ncbi:MAG: four helix bundle protein [Dehalococcoidia bacterium]
MRIERFEDIEAWKEARKLVNMIYDISDEEKFSRDFGLKNQIRDASVSVMSNIVEGFDRGTNREFIQFLIVGRASASEVRSQLYVALDRKYITSDKFHEICDQISKLISLIDGFIRYLRKPRTPNPEPRT